MLDQLELQKILPQAYPFLLIDRVENVQPGQSLVAIKNITSDEWPLMNCSERLLHYPETLLIEAAAQAALVLYRVSKDKFNIQNSWFILGQIKATFQNSIVAGQQLTINTVASKMLDEFGYMNMALHANLKETIAEVEIYYRVTSKNNAEKYT